MKDDIKIKGKIIIFKKDKYNELIKVYEKNNLVVDTGLNFLVQKLDGDSIADMGWIAVGTDSTPVVATDTTLGVEILRKAFVDTDTVNNLWRAEAQFDVGEAVANWKEAAIFNASSGGIMFNRVNIDFDKLTDETVIVRFEITFNA